VLFGELYKSTDGGWTWQPTGTGLPRGVASLAVNPVVPTTLYAATFLPDAGLHKSTDGGASWSATGLTPEQGAPVTALAIDPRNPETVYAGDDCCVVYKSTDGGVTWSHSHPGGTGIHALAVDPHNPASVYAGLSAGRVPGVRKSTDGGATWTPINTGLPPYQNYVVEGLVIDPTAAATLYARLRAVEGTAGFSSFMPSVWKSTDAGEHWSSVGAGMSCKPFGDSVYYAAISSLAIDPLEPATLYSGEEPWPCYNFVLRTRDGGGQWSPYGKPYVTTAVTALAINPVRPWLVYAATRGGGVYISTSYANNTYLPLILRAE
jgi:photosystem II stability/assembly factor-like uncharacterized protein